jgi:hypothetical protein
LVRVVDRSGSCVHAQFREDVLEVGADSGWGDDQVSRDLFIRETDPCELEDFAFAGSQKRRKASAQPSLPNVL